MRKKKTREENEAASKVFAEKMNSNFKIIDKIRPYFYGVTFSFIIFFCWNRWLYYSPLLLVAIIGGYLLLFTCCLLPSLKRYITLLDLLFIIYLNTTTNIIDLLQGKPYELIHINVISFPFFGFMIIGFEFISIATRKWLLFFVILVLVGVMGYVFENPKLEYYRISSCLNLVSNIFAFVAINRREKAEKEKEVEQLKQSQPQAKLSSLKDQLSPHFLFNTLNTITSISQEQTVKDFVDEVANIYRYVLQYKEVDSVTIRQEIEFINSYLFILKSRLEGGIDFYVNINSERIMDTKIPPLTLQMLVENAVKHNITSIDNPLNINIFVVDGPLLVIQNNYQPKISVLPTNQTGLKNIAERYRLLYKKEIIVENKNGFFTVKLPIVIA